MNKHFTIIEINTDEGNCNIGTITDIPNNPQGIASFKDRFLTALEQHFDIEDFNYGTLPDIFQFGTHKHTIGIEADGMNFEVEILETWIY